jgi:hypothetical protein
MGTFFYGFRGIIVEPKVLRNKAVLILVYERSRFKHALLG